VVGHLGDHLVEAFPSSDGHQDRFVVGVERQLRSEEGESLISQPHLVPTGPACPPDQTKLSP